MVTIPKDPDLMVKYNKENVKAKCIFLDAVRNHLIPHLTSKMNAFDMWEALIKLFQNDNQNQK